MSSLQADVRRLSTEQPAAVAASGGASMNTRAVRLSRANPQCILSAAGLACVRLTKHQQVKRIWQAMLGRVSWEGCSIVSGAFHGPARRYLRCHHASIRGGRLRPSEVSR